MIEANMRVKLVKTFNQHSIIKVTIKFRSEIGNAILIESYYISLHWGNMAEIACQYKNYYGTPSTGELVAKKKHQSS